MKYGLGIDTGGTYTDSVIIDLDSGIVVSRSKSLTTRDNLAKGIGLSLSGLDDALLSEVKLVSLSSTLATNSVVEGKKCRVGLISIGKKAGFTMPVNQYRYADGKFDFMGNEIVPLDTDAVRESLLNMKDSIDSLAVAGYLSVRNPNHENIVRKIAHEMLNIPVVCAHELTAELGFNERTNTAVMNAGLIPIMVELIDAVEKTLSCFGIEAPVMVVKGDGTVMNADTAKEKPVDTILSGPASSIIGATTLTGIKDALIIDMGGTTSDMGIVEKGFPRTENGAVVGSHKTRIRAADIGTYGIGGDSRIVVNGNKLMLASTRSIPICVAAAKWPRIKNKLSDIEKSENLGTIDYSNVADIVQKTEFFTPASNTDLSCLSEINRKFIKMISDEPKTVNEVASALDVAIHSFALGDLESRGYVTRIGFTPTDITAVKGQYNGFDANASSICVRILSQMSGMSVETFTDTAEKLVDDKICRCIMDFLMKDVEDTVRNAIENMIIEHGTQPYSLGICLGIPMIGIGAPASAWLTRAASKFGCKLILPDNYDIGNAIGTVAGSVSETVAVTVKASPNDLSDNPECSVFSSEGVSKFSDIDSAVRYAETEGKMLAERAAKKSGATEIMLDTKCLRDMKDLVGDGIPRFRGAVITVRATGKPAFLKSKEQLN